MGMSGESTDTTQPEDAPFWWFHVWECGWCDDEVTALTKIGVHVRLLWHQWWNHRERIWEEY